MVEPAFPMRLTQGGHFGLPDPRPSARGSTDVPTLFRFFATIAILAGLVFAGMFALATFVKPTPREMIVSIPAAKLQPPR